MLVSEAIERYGNTVILYTEVTYIDGQPIFLYALTTATDFLAEEIEDELSVSDVDQGSLFIDIDQLTGEEILAYLCPEMRQYVC